MAPETASVPGLDLESSPSSPIPDPSPSSSPSVPDPPSSSTLLTTTSHPSASRLSVSLSAHSRRLFTLRAVHTFYHHWAHFIVRNTWACLVFCTLLTIACTVKIALTPQQNDITNYTPYGARSRHELTIQQQFFNAQGLGNHLGAFVLLMPLHRDDPARNNFLHPAMLAEAARVDDIVRKQFPLLNHRVNRTQTFEDFCTDFCDINEPMRRFEEGFRIQSERLASNQSLNPTIQLNYPTSSILGRKFNIQPNFFGITFHSKNSTNNDSTAISNMERVEMLVLTYKAERVGGWSDAEVEGWEMAISDFFANEFHSDLVRTMTTSVTHVNAEVVRAGLSMLPFLVIGFVIMALCSSVCVFLSASYWRQWHPRKLHLALAACICPFMACGTALGLLFLFGVRFGSILCVTPFLVLAIGVDDAYLMIHAWQRVTERARRKRILEAGSAKAEKENLEAAEEEDPVAHRLELVLVDTGPAILISALTNICADAVGAFTGSPEITLLCVGNMTAMAVDFLYQVTFYAAIMALVGRAELRDEMRKQSEKQTKANGNNQKQLDKMEKGPSRSISRKVHTFIDHYVRLISHPIMASLITLFWITFLVFSAIGISRFEVNLSTKKLFAADSPLLEIDHYREQQIVPFFQMATVFINSPTNMSDPHRMARIRALVEGMEQLPESWGPQSTNDVLRELEQYIGEEDGGDMEGWLEQFLDWPESRYWRGFIRHPAPEANWNGTGNGTKADMLDSFYFTTGYHGQKLKLWSERTQLLKKWRAVVDRFADDLNASVFHDESIFLDLIDNMPTDAWQSAVTTLCAMCAICALFLGTDLRSVVLAGTIIASIIAGTLGILSWLGTTMDPIMMAALIISIGFSVDIPAHVSYHFHTSAFELHSSASSSALPPSIPDRLRATLASVGLPALQASLSTSLCVLSLLFVPLYMARVFVLIMCSTIALCILHSLVLLPALLSLTDRVRCGRICGGHRSEEDQSANRGIKQFRN